MIQLYSFTNCMPGTPDPSGFVVKIMTLLNLAGLPYERIELENPAKGPKGKVPFINDDGKLLGDSTLIIEHLRQTRGLDLDAHLTADERTQSHMLQRMLEERLYWAIVYSRWIDPINRHIPKAVFFRTVPWPLRGLVAHMATKTVRQALFHHGLGRHSPDEIYQFGCADIQAVSETLGDKPFLFGSAPSTADATAFGMLINIAGPDVPSPLRDKVHANPILMAYLSRVQSTASQSAQGVRQNVA